METKQKYMTAEELRAQASASQKLRDEVIQDQVDQFLTDIFYPEVQAYICQPPKSVEMVVFSNCPDLDLDFDVMTRDGKFMTGDGKFTKFMIQNGIRMCDLGNSDFFRLLRITMTSAGFTVTVPVDGNAEARLKISWAEQKATKR